MTPGVLTSVLGVEVAVHARRAAVVKIMPRNLVRLEALARGRQPEDIIAVASRLFALCATAQTVAAAAAVEAARGVPAPDGVLRRRHIAVLAERLLELLRGTITGLAGADAVRFAPSLQRIARASRMLSLNSSVEDSAVENAIRGIELALAELGLDQDDLVDARSVPAWLHEDSPLATIVRPIAQAGEADFGCIDVDPLDAACDQGVAAALLDGGAAFAAQPAVAGRVPETGALARNAASPPLDALCADAGAGTLLRFLARLVEIRSIPQSLRALAGGESHRADAHVICSYALGEGRGFSAVECARGRLHHLVALDRQGRIDRFESVAPTEWNFHPRGPLAAALTGAPLSTDASSARRVERLVAAFDPCVDYRVAVTEAGHA